MLDRFVVCGRTYFKWANLAAVQVLAYSVIRTHDSNGVHGVIHVCVPVEALNKYECKKYEIEVLTFRLFANHLKVPC